jgi:hypothetical protein
MGLRELETMDPNINENRFYRFIENWSILFILIFFEKSEKTKMEKAE